MHRILMIDDDPDVRRILSILLGGWGYRAGWQNLVRRVSLRSQWKSPI